MAEQHVPDTDFTTYGTQFAPTGGDGVHSYTCVNTADDDTSYVAQSASGTGNIEYRLDLPAATVVPAGTYKFKWRAKKTSGAITGTNNFAFQIVLQNSAGVYSRYETGNLDLNTGTYLITDSYVDYEFSFTLADIAGGSTAPSDRHINMSIFGGGNVAMRVTYFALETPHFSSDTPTAGAASVTMTGQASVSRGSAQARGASVTMTGAMVPSGFVLSPGAPPVQRAGMNTYHFMPLGMDILVGQDDMIMYQGMGNEPASKADKKAAKEATKRAPAMPAEMPSEGPLAAGPPLPVVAPPPQPKPGPREHFGVKRRPR